MQTSELPLSRGKRPVAKWFSCILLALLSSPYTFAATVNVPLSAKSLQTLQAAQQQISDKKYKRALELSTEVLAENHQQFEAQFIQAEALSYLGKTNESVSLYKSILKTNPLHPEVYNNLANLYAQQGHLDLARQTLEQGIATNEQYKTLYENLSAIYVEMARGAYSKALKLGVQAKAVHLKTLSVASIDQASPSQPADASSAKQVAAISAVVKPMSASAEKNTVTKIAAGNVDSNATHSTQTGSTRIAMVEDKAESAVAAPAAKKEAETSKPVLSPRVKNTPTVKIEPNFNKDEVITALHGWAAAWSAQAVDLYLSFYGDEFKPGKLSRKVWAVQRRIRIKKPHWINVQLADFEVKIKSAHNGHVVVQLVQDYNADNYHDKTKKQFEMKHTMDGWRILSEQTLAVIK